MANVPASGSYHVLMDALPIAYSLNELVLHVNLQGWSNLHLEFEIKEFGDEPQALPSFFTGSYNGDGVAISQDGVSWYTLMSFNPTSSYVLYDIDLDAAIASAGRWRSTRPSLSRPTRSMCSAARGPATAPSPKDSRPNARYSGSRTASTQ